MFEQVEEHVRRHVIEAAWDAVERHDADAVVSFGGGSTIDLGKALVYLANEGWEAFDAGAAPRFRIRPRLIHVAVPTTYSGAEATRRFWVTQGHVRRSLGGLPTRPSLVIADPGLSLALPWKPTAATGMGALARCLEALCSWGSTPDGDADTTRAVAAIRRLLPVVVADPARVVERADLLAASYAAGAVSDLGTSGLMHALALGLGARSGVPFGIAAALAMPPIIRSLALNRVDGVGAFAGALAGVDGDDPVEELPPDDRAAVAERAADDVQAFARELGLPAKLREVGVFEEDLDVVAEWVTTADLGGIRLPPRTDRQRVLAILREAW